ncbi:MAG: hypothetical protein K8I02_04040, partial [Candidatus Methylomirabilis sp.]|nr:hypothetical protein [Deltaproteobacteria bacterium]
WGLANLSGTQVDVVAGSGRLGGVLHETAAPTTVTGLTPGQINYIRVQAGVGGVPVFTPAASKLAGAVYVGHVDMVGEVLVTYAPDGTAEMAFTPIAAAQTLTFNHQLGRVPRRDEIDLLFRPVGTTGEADFHPTFQVEAADGAGVAIRAVTDTQLVIQAGNGAPGYNAFYTLGPGGTLLQYASGSIKCSIRRRTL